MTALRTPLFPLLIALCGCGSGSALRSDASIRGPNDQTLAGSEPATADFNEADSTEMVKMEPATHAAPPPEPGRELVSRDTEDEPAGDDVLDEIREVEQALHRVIGSDDLPDAQLERARAAAALVDRARAALESGDAAAARLLLEKARVIERDLASS